MGVQVTRIIGPDGRVLREEVEGVHFIETIHGEGARMEEKPGRKLPGRVRLGGATEFVKRPSQAGTQQRIEEMLKEMGKGVRAGRVKACLLLALDAEGRVEFATVADATQFATLVAQVPQVMERVAKELKAATELDRAKGKVQ